MSEPNNCRCNGKKQYPSQPHCNCKMQDLSGYGDENKTMIRTRRKREQMAVLQGKRRGKDGTR